MTATITATPANPGTARGTATVTASNITPGSSAAAAVPVTVQGT